MCFASPALSAHRFSISSSSFGCSSSLPHPFNFQNWALRPRCDGPSCRLLLCGFYPHPHPFASGFLGNWAEGNNGFVRDVGASAKVASHGEAWRHGGGSMMNANNVVMDSNTAGFARAVLSPRTENCLRAFAPESFRCAVGGPACCFKEQCVSLIGEVKCQCSVDGNENSGSCFKGASTPLKNKRPPRLNIPDPPKTVAPAKFQEPVKELSVEGMYYAVFCKKGRREVMEDAHRAITDFQGNAKQAFFGVFDGHGGRSAVDFVAEHLPQEIANAIESSRNIEDRIEDSVAAAFIATDSAFLRKSADGGATCVAVLIRNGYLVVANAGDCRIVMSRVGKAEALTRDHKAGREDERQRIENLGGYVDCFNGVWRVQGVLAISRGFGDRNLKDFISAKPEVRKLSITSDCDFLILASDGLWDKVGNQEAVDCIRSVLEESQITQVNANATGGNPARGTLSACKKLVALAASRGSVDDISVIIVHLRHFG